MNVKLRVLSAGAVFFLGAVAFAQTTKRDTAQREKQIEEVVVQGYRTVTKKLLLLDAVQQITAETIETELKRMF